MIGKNLDLTSGDNLPSRNRGSGHGRKFLGIHFLCCDVYCRVYVNRDNTAYEGYCPRCYKPVRIKIGEGGLNCRFFKAE